MVACLDSHVLDHHAQHIKENSMNIVLKVIRGSAVLNTARCKQMAVIYGNGECFIRGSHFSWSLCTVLLSVGEPRANQAALLRTFAQMLWECELGLGVENAQFSLLY